MPYELVGIFIVTLVHYKLSIHKDDKYTPVHSAGYLILRNEFRSTQEIARQNIQVSFYIRSTGL